MVSNDNVAGLSWSERWFALRSIFPLRVFSISIRRFGFTPTYRWLERRLKNNNLEVAGDLSAQSIQQAIQIGRLVGAGNRRFKSWMVPCLPESLTVWWYLQRRGIQAHLLLGVRKTENELDGHAWVEVGGQVVSGDPHLASQFTPMNLGNP